MRDFDMSNDLSFALSLMLLRSVSFPEILWKLYRVDRTYVSTGKCFMLNIWMSACYSLTTTYIRDERACDHGAIIAVN